MEVARSCPKVTVWASSVYLMLWDKRKQVGSIWRIMGLHQLSRLVWVIKPALHGHLCMLDVVDVMAVMVVSVLP